MERVGPSHFELDPFSHRKKVNGAQGASFKDTLNSFLKDVNDSQSASSELQRKFLSGEVTDVHQVISKSDEANVVFNMLMEIRNKVLDGYNEIMRIRL